MTINNDNVGKCGHARCAGGNGILCFYKGAPMRPYKKIDPKTCDNCASTLGHNNSSGDFQCDNCGHDEGDTDDMSPSSN